MSKVNLEYFSDEFKKSLSIKRKIEPNTFLKDIEEFDSMGKITTSLLIEELFNFTIDYETLDKTKTLNELYNVCQKRIKNKDK